MRPVYNNELTHFGKRGMKWGHRKNRSTNKNYNTIDKYTISRDGERIRKSVQINNYDENAPIRLTDNDKMKIGMAAVALVIAASRNKK